MDRKKCEWRMFFSGWERDGRWHDLLVGSIAPVRSGRTAGRSGGISPPCHFFLARAANACEDSLIETKAEVDPSFPTRTLATPELRFDLYRSVRPPWESTHVETVLVPLVAARPSRRTADRQGKHPAAQKWLPATAGNPGGSPAARRSVGGGPAELAAPVLRPGPRARAIACRRGEDGRGVASCLDDAQRRGVVRQPSRRLDAG